MRNLIGVLSILFICLSAYAQEFTPIVEDYNCARFSNGKQFLVKKSETGFALVKSSEVKERFNKQRRVYVQREKLIGEKIRFFKAKRIIKSELLRELNSTLKKIFKEQALPSTILPDEAEAQALAIRTRIQAEIKMLDTLKSLLNDCESGINPKKGSGTAFSPLVQPIAVAMRTGIIGGALITTAPQKVEFSTKPGGYNGCLKTIYPTGEVFSVYTGFGRDENRCFPGNFGDLTPSQCLALIPEGRVGYVIQLAQYNFLTLPGVTTEELVDRMRLDVTPSLPVVSILAFLKNISRDRSVSLCESF